MRWYTWRDGGYRPFELPPVGKTTIIPELPLSTAIQQIVSSQLKLWLSFLQTSS